MVVKVSVSFATIAEYLEPSLWVVLMYAYKKEGEILGCSRCWLSANLPSRSNVVKVLIW